MRKLAIAAFLFTCAITIAQTKTLGDFDEIKVFDQISVTLVASSENKIEISGKRSRDVEVVNKNGELKVRMRLGRLLDGEDVSAIVYYTKLESVDASEGSKITSSEMFTQTKMEVTAKEGAEIELNLDVKKVDVKSVTGGAVRLSGNAEYMEAKLGTGGILQAKNLQTTQTDVSISAGGEAEVKASELVDANVKVGGNVKVYGSPKQINKKTALGGNYRGK